MSALVRGARASVQRLIPTVVVLLSIVVVAVAACEETKDPPLPPSVQEYREKSHIAQLAKLRVGVRTDQPLMGYRQGNRYTGFDIEVAKKLAELLGFGHEGGVEFVPVDISDRETALATGLVNLVVASYSITEDRKAKGVRFAGPYLVTTQEVLIPIRLVDKVTKLSDLKKYRVCVSGGSTSAQHLRDEGIKADVLNTDGECIRAIRTGEYDAMSTDETILAGYAHLYSGEFEIVKVPFGEPEKLGIGVPGNDKYLQALINHYLMESYLKREGSWWQSAFDATLGSASIQLSEYAQRQPQPEMDVKLIDHGDKVSPKPQVAAPAAPAPAVLVALAVVTPRRVRRR